MLSFICANSIYNATVDDLAAVAIQCLPSFAWTRSEICPNIFGCEMVCIRNDFPFYKFNSKSLTWRNDVAANVQFQYNISSARIHLNICIVRVCLFVCCFYQSNEWTVHQISAKEMDLIMTMNGIDDGHIIFLFHTQNDAPAYIPICSVMRLNDRTNYKHKIFPNN